MATEKICSNCAHWEEEKCEIFGGKYPKDSKLAETCQEFVIEARIDKISQKKRGRKRGRKKGRKKGGKNSGRDSGPENGQPKV